MRILVLGASGMLGNALFRYFLELPRYSVFGTIRNHNSKSLFPKDAQKYLLPGVEVENTDVLINVFSKVKPDIIFNCIGLVKQLEEAESPLVAIPINSLLPHRLALLSSICGARLVHFSTDCVFSGLKGMYVESDYSDSYDLYGRSKFLGEVDYRNAITIRTSIIGHELTGSKSLVNWFLAQDGEVRGYKNAIFSGLPTVEIARILNEFILPNPNLCGMYHISADPISKYELLNLIAKEYNKIIKINQDTSVRIDRSLDSTRFRNLTGYYPKPWGELVKLMREFG